MSRSIASSVQCCIVISGSGEPVRTIFISQRPALRTGISTAEAFRAGSTAGKQDANQSAGSRRIMLRAPRFGRLLDRASLVERAQRHFGGAIGHPAAGKGNEAALLRVNGQEFHDLSA